MEALLNDVNRPAGIVTGDGLVVSTGTCTLSASELQHAALVFRALCALHGSDRDEYRMQRGPRFHMDELAVADQLQPHTR